MAVSVSGPMAKLDGPVMPGGYKEPVLTRQAPTPDTGWYLVDGDTVECNRNTPILGSVTARPTVSKSYMHDYCNEVVTI